ERVRGHRVRRDVDHGAEVAAAVADVHLGPVRRDGDPGRGFPGAEDRADRIGRRVDHGYATRDAGDGDVPAVGGDRDAGRAVADGHGTGDGVGGRVDDRDRAV